VSRRREVWEASRRHLFLSEKSIADSVALRPALFEHLFACVSTVYRLVSNSALLELLLFAYHSRSLQWRIV
jgi:hypothetical protein